MGMAAGQARLLSITSRMSDNELRAQIINNNKMRLASESSQVSENYVAALNEAQYMFTNYDADDNKSFQQLTFNALTSYNPYNNQYALTNASGNILLSERDAENYENSSNLSEFLAKYGLEYDTTYFDQFESGIDFYTAITDVHGNAKGFQGLTIDKDTLYKMYTGVGGGTYNLLPKISGIANNGYDTINRSQSMNNYNTNLEIYSDKKEIFLAYSKEAVKKVLATAYAAPSVSSAANGSAALDIAINYANKLKGSGWCSSESLNYYNEIINKLNGLKTNPYTDPDEVTKGGGYYLASGTGGNYLVWWDGDPNTKPEIEFKVNGNNLLYYPSCAYAGEVLDGFGGTSINGVFNPDSNGSAQNFESVYYNDDGSEGTIQLQYYSNLGFNNTEDGVFKFRMRYTDEDLKSVASGYIAEMELTAVEKWDNITNWNTFLGPIAGTPFATTVTNAYNEYKQAATDLYSTIFGPTNPFDINRIAIMDDIITLYNNYGDSFCDAFKPVFANILLDVVMDTYGEPKFGWIDINDNNKNADAKARWYENIYNRIQSGGYKVLQDGLASSPEWIRFAFESGVINMEQVDSYNAWNTLIYTNCSDITTQTSDQMVAKAEAEYKAAMSKITNKDKRYDMELKNIDTEHNSLQTEYDSIKTAIDKNSERNFKLYS